MDRLDLQVLQQARDWHACGRAVCLATVVETRGSAPRPLGAMLALRDDGLLVGSVSGGCVEDDLIDRVRAGERLARPALVAYGATEDAASRAGLPCGGMLRLVQEPLSDAAWIDELLARTARHERVARRLDIVSGAVRVEGAARGEPLRFDGRQLWAPVGPGWRLVMIGAGQLSRAVAPMAQALDFEVVCCDPREEYHATWDLRHTRLSTEMPDDLVRGLGLDPYSAVVALSHDPKLDDLALIEALRTPAFYVGALGSRANAEKRKARLRLFELGEAELARLHGPVGLDLGARTPAEIAVSVVAELVAVRCLSLRV